MNKPAFIPTEATGKLIADWCNQGINKPTISERINECKSIKELLQLFQEEQIQDEGSITAFSNKRKQLEEATLNNFIQSQSKINTNGIPGATISGNK